MRPIILKTQWQPSQNIENNKRDVESSQTIIESYDEERNHSSNSKHQKTKTDKINILENKLERKDKKIESLERLVENRDDEIKNCTKIKIV